MKCNRRQTAMLVAAILVFSFAVSSLSAVQKQIPVSLSQNEKSGYDLYWPITAKEFVEAFNATAAARGEKSQRIDSFKKKDTFSAGWEESKANIFVYMLNNGYISRMSLTYQLGDEDLRDAGRSVLKSLVTTLCRNDKKKADALYKKLISQEKAELEGVFGSPVDSNELIAENCRFYFSVDPVYISIDITPQENKSTKEGAPIPSRTPGPATPSPTPNANPFVYLELNGRVYHRRKSCPELNVKNGELMNQAYLSAMEKSKLYVPCPECAVKK